jgi:hypothetical protein
VFVLLFDRLFILTLFKQELEKEKEAMVEQNLPEATPVLPGWVRTFCFISLRGNSICLKLSPHSLVCVSFL